MLGISRYYTTIGLDGITVNHAGELLFDSLLTTQHRYHSRETYVRSLEDFAFAMVYGDKYAVRGSMGKVGSESPGQLIVQKYRDWFQDLDQDDPSRPESRVKESSFRENVERILLCLATSYYMGRVHWNQLFAREARTEMLFAEDGNSPNPANQLLTMALADPSAYEFYRPQPYLADRELLDQIPESGFVAEIRTFLQPLYPGVCAAALDEFIRRATLTHVVIYLHNDLVKARPRSGVFRLPHVTRTCLEFAAATKRSEVMKNRLTSFCVRHALAEAVEQSLGRDEVADCLGTLSGMKKYTEIRRKLRELTAVHNSFWSSESKKVREAQKLMEDVKKSASSGSITDNTYLSMNPIGPSVSVRAGSVMDQMKPSRKALRGVANWEGATEYLAKIDRVFPELRLGYAGAVPTEKPNQAVS